MKHALTISIDSEIAFQLKEIAKNGRFRNVSHFAEEAIKKMLRKIEEESAKSFQKNDNLRFIP